MPDRSRGRAAVTRPSTEGSRHMNLQVVGRGYAVTPELRERAERKLQKLERRVGDNGSAEVTLSSERNPSIGSGEIAEVRVQLGAETLHVRESASSMEAALD